MKAEVVGIDERESGLRMILNFGHTLGHAIEAVTGYKKLLHGEAIAWGMLAALNLSRSRQLLPEKEAQRIAPAHPRLWPAPSLPRHCSGTARSRRARQEKHRPGPVASSSPPASVRPSSSKT